MLNVSEASEESNHRSYAYYAYDGNTVYKCYDGTGLRCLCVRVKKNLNSSKASEHARNQGGRNVKTFAG